MLPTEQTVLAKPKVHNMNLDTPSNLWHCDKMPPSQQVSLSIFCPTRAAPVNSKLSSNSSPALKQKATKPHKMGLESGCST